MAQPWRTRLESERIFVKKIVVFISEILSAKTLLPIIHKLQKEPLYDLRFFNDGFCREFVETLDLPVEYIIDNFEARMDSEVRDASLVLLGKSYVEPAEYALLRCAHRQGVPVAMVIPDMGIDVVQAKLRGVGDWGTDGVPWPNLLLAEERTYQGLISLGVPAHQLTMVGNPYFDELYNELQEDKSQWNGKGIGYFSTPFELDWQRGILPATYAQSKLIDDIRSVAIEVGADLLAKRHPQVPASLFPGIDLFEGTPLEMIRIIRVAVGSYSTTLLEAFAAGIPTISYQPWAASIRNDVFTDRIPIVRTREQLSARCREVLYLKPERKVTTVTSNPGSSLKCATDAIRHLLRQRINIG